MDKSNGYEDIAARFIQSRTKTIGTSSVQLWARTLPPTATVLDLGCGMGLPVSEVLIDEGLEVYGIDASPTLAQAFHLNFPHSPIACEAVEESLFFGRQFDAIIAWGLLFLLTVDSQQIVIQKVAKALPPGGKFLFTAPSQAVSWKDALTACDSTSLGAQKYKALLSASGLRLFEEFDDEGGNHYFSAIKI